MSSTRFKEIRIENTNACGYKCTMCPREKLTRQIGYMPVEDFSLVLDRVGPFNGSFHLHGFGEPLLDRQFTEKVSILKSVNPTSKAVIFSTLGVKVKEGFFEELSQAGLDFLVVSLYGFTKEAYRGVHGFDGLERVKLNLEKIASLKKPFRVCVKIPGRHLNETLPMVKSDDEVGFRKWISDLGFEVGHWEKAHNYGDGRAFNKPSEKMCPVIDGRRKEILNITWDLNVIPCCFDFNATIRFGNLRDSTLEEIFSGPEYLKFYLAHQTADLSDYPVCQNCEKIDYL